MSKTISEIIDVIRRNRRFVITAHDNLDGDSIGSALALATALSKKNKDVGIVFGGPVPWKYRFLPDLNKFIGKKDNFVNKKTVLFVLDTAGWGQMEKLNPEKFNGNIIINIDHHIDNKKFGKINWVDPGASAVGEQIYNLLKEMSVPLNPGIALCLYIAISSDTGSFQYSNTTYKTHKIVSQLIRYGAQPNIISEKIFGNISISRLRLLQMALGTLKLQNGIIWVWITKKMFRLANAKKEDTETFIDYLKTVTGVKVAVVFKDGLKPNEKRVTFRSKDSNIAVNKIAHRFGGGGHPAASGCTIKGSRKEVEREVLDAVRSAVRNP